MYPTATTSSLSHPPPHEPNPRTQNKRQQPKCRINNTPTQCSNSSPHQKNKTITNNMCAPSSPGRTRIPYTNFVPSQPRLSESPRPPPMVSPSLPERQTPLGRVDDQEREGRNDKKRPTLPNQPEHAHRPETTTQERYAVQRTQTKPPRKEYSTVSSSMGCSQEEASDTAVNQTPTPRQPRRPTTARRARAGSARAAGRGRPRRWPRARPSRPTGRACRGRGWRRRGRPRAARP